MTYIYKKGEEATKDVPATKDGKPYSERLQRVKRINMSKEDALKQYNALLKRATPESQKKRREDMKLLRAVEKYEPNTRHWRSGSKSGKVFKDEYAKNKAKNVLRAKHGMPLLPTEAPKAT